MSRPAINCFVGRLDDNVDYVKAVEQENFNRDVQFLELTETIGGFECRQITLADITLFRIQGNTTFSRSRIPTIEDFAAFLWLLNPGYSRTSRFKRWLFLQRVRRAFVPENQLGPAE